MKSYLNLAIRGCALLIAFAWGGARIDAAVAGYSAAGSNLYTSGGLRLLNSKELQRGEDAFYCGVWDKQRGYAYFGTLNSPSSIVKFRVNNGDTSPTRVSALKLPTGVGNLGAAVIDEAAGYAYFATRGYFSAQHPYSFIVKIRLNAGDSTPTLINVLQTPDGNNQYISGMIDPAAGYAYFPGGLAYGVLTKVKLGAGDAPLTFASYLKFTRAKERLLAGCAIDTTRGLALVGTNASIFNETTDTVIKVKLNSGNTTPTRLNAVTLAPNEKALKCAVMDAAAGFAYFGTSGNPGHVVKVQVNNEATSPTRIGGFTLATLDTTTFTGVQSAAIDPARGYAFFGAYNGTFYPNVIFKVALGAGAAPAVPSSYGKLQYPENFTTSLLINPATGYLLAGLDIEPGRVVKLTEGAGGAAPVRVSAAEGILWQAALTTVLNDPTHGYVYYISNKTPARIYKFKIGSGFTAPVLISMVTLPTEDGGVMNGIIDVEKGYGYLAMVRAADLTHPALSQIVKIALGSGDTLPTRAGSVAMQPDDTYLGASAIDPINRYAYFTSSNRIRKYKLPVSTGLPQLVSTYTDPGASFQTHIFSCAVLDPPNKLGYFVNLFNFFTDYPHVFKIRLGNGDSTPTLSYASAQLDSGDYSITKGVLDSTRGVLYFLSTGSEARISKVLTYGNDDFVGRIAVTEFFQTTPESIYLDEARNRLYFGSYDTPRDQTRIRVMDPGTSYTTTFTPVGDFFASKTAGFYPWNLTPAGDGNHLLIGSNDNPSVISKLATSPLGAIHATSITLKQTAKVTALSFYSHKAGGQMRMAIYGSDNNKKWESAASNNTTTEGFVTVLIGAGTPSSLQLAPGNYWLALQVNGDPDAASEVPDMQLENKYAEYNFGAFPPYIVGSTPQGPAWQATARRWAGYVTYTPFNGVERKLWFEYR